MTLDILSLQDYHHHQHEDREVQSLAQVVPRLKKSQSKDGMSTCSHHTTTSTKSSRSFLRLIDYTSRKASEADLLKMPVLGRILNGNKKKPNGSKTVRQTASASTPAPMDPISLRATPLAKPRLDESCATFEWKPVSSDLLGAIDGQPQLHDSSTTFFVRQDEARSQRRARTEQTIVQALQQMGLDVVARRGSIGSRRGSASSRRSSLGSRRGSLESNSRRQRRRGSQQDDHDNHGDDDNDKEQSECPEYHESILGKEIAICGKPSSSNSNKNPYSPSSLYYGGNDENDDKDEEDEPDKDYLYDQYGYADETERDMDISETEVHQDVTQANDDDDDDSERSNQQQQQQYANQDLYEELYRSLGYEDCMSVTSQKSHRSIKNSRGSAANRRGSISSSCSSKSHRRESSPSRNALGIRRRRSSKTTLLLDMASKDQEYKDIFQGKTTNSSRRCRRRQDPVAPPATGQRSSSARNILPSSGGKAKTTQGPLTSASLLQHMRPASYHYHNQQPESDDDDDDDEADLFQLPASMKDTHRRCAKTNKSSALVSSSDSPNSTSGGLAKLQQQQQQQQQATIIHDDNDDVTETSIACSFYDASEALMPRSRFSDDDDVSISLDDVASSRVAAPNHHGIKNSPQSQRRPARGDNRRGSMETGAGGPMEKNPFQRQSSKLMLLGGGKLHQTSAHSHTATNHHRTNAQHHHGHAEFNPAFVGLGSRIQRYEVR